MSQLIIYYFIVLLRSRITGYLALFFMPFSSLALNHAIIQPAAPWTVSTTTNNIRHYTHTEHPKMQLTFDDKKFDKNPVTPASSLIFGELALLLDKDESLSWKILHARERDAAFFWQGRHYGIMSRVIQLDHQEVTTVLTLPSDITPQEYHFALKTLTAIKP